MSDQQQPGTAVAVPLQPMIEQYAGEFGKVLPRHVGAERFERWCLSLLRQSVRGAQAEAWQRVLSSPQGQASVMSGFMRAASLGLEPGYECHLVPFGSEVTFITDYKGEIKLIYNAGRMPVIAMLVRKGDVFGMRGANVPPLHEPADGDWFGERGPVVGGYAYCEMAPGVYSLVVTMSEADFEHHKAKARTKNVWDEWPEAMRLKTLIHQLRKFVPWSAEVLP